MTKLLSKSYIIHQLRVGYLRHLRDPSGKCIISFSISILINNYIKTATSSKPEMLICYSPDICMLQNDYFSKRAISNAAAPPESSDERKIDGESWHDDDLETDSEPDIHKSSKSLSSTLKDKTTTSLPKKRKKHKCIAEAWQYFKIEENFAVCQVEITQDGKKKKCEQKYDHTNSNSTTSMNYHIIQEHDIVLKSLAKKVEKKEQVILEQVLDNVKPHGPNKQNKLQATCTE
ncbi:16202_t:CDS:2 [Cetraspora pellucida]|uniref:16202_t:CDS:1 n=1 Tax=Cetraspora pellucida TaxID=1433469 RepID=A0ACA9MEK5_9GLOM|nr:16202_t:CDS:2 [Cetraspora pellucida]